MVNLFSKMSDLAIGSSQLIRAYISGKIVGEVTPHDIFQVTNFHKNVYFYCPEVNRECEQVEVLSFTPKKEADYKLIVTNVEINGLFELNQNIYMNIGGTKFNPSVIQELFKIDIAAFVLAVLTFVLIKRAMGNSENQLGFEQRMVQWLSIMLIIKNQPFTDMSLEISEKLFFVELAATVAFYCLLVYFWIVMLSV